VTAQSRAASDTRHRVPYPNARPRRVALIGLGERGRAVAATVEAAHLSHVSVVCAPAASAPVADSDALLRSIADGADDVARALADADMIFAAVGGGDDASYVQTLARLAHHRNVLLTGVIIDDTTTPERGLEIMRRACDMLVITADADYLVGMLGALGTP
jgi:3-hydroxyisobutyrate dehydrogenase-like beta-hydroxyacid dehydrogenase